MGLVSVAELAPQPCVFAIQRHFHKLPRIYLHNGQTVFRQHHIDAAVDELRVSDVQRYLKDFEPSRKAELELDEHTRALFHLNGNLQGESWQHEGDLPATLTDQRSKR